MKSKLLGLLLGSRSSLCPPKVAEIACLDSLRSYLYMRVMQPKMPAEVARFSSGHLPEEWVFALGEVRVNLGVDVVALQLLSST